MGECSGIFCRHRQTMISTAVSQRSEWRNFITVFESKVHRFGKSFLFRIASCERRSRKITTFARRTPRSLQKRSHRCQRCEGIDRHHRPMDWRSGFCLNRLIRLRQEVDYMPDNKLVIAIEKSQSEHYAVVELRWKETFPELMIAYCDDESLRKLIAAPNIIGIVLCSRQAVIPDVQNSSSSGADSKRLPDQQTSEHGAGDREFQSASMFLRPRVGLSEIPHIVFETVQRAVVAGILMLYSTNILGAAIRALVSA